MQDLKKIIANRKPKHKRKMTYTVILHQPREKLGISVHEYCVADLIYHFGNLTRSREMGGWCYASKELMANCLNLGKKTIDRAINKLLKLEIIEKHPATRYLRSTQKWYNEVISYKSELKRVNDKP